MIIIGEHKIKQVKRSLLVLMASIEASLRYTIDPDLASGYAILRDRANDILTTIKPVQDQMVVTSLADQRTLVIATHRMVTEFERMHKPCGDLVDLYNDLLTAYTSENTDDPESREKTPAIVTLSGGLRSSGLGAPGG